MQPNGNDTSDMISYNASLAMWQDIIITGGQYKDGALSGEAEINLVNKNVNSLKQLSAYFDQMSKGLKAKQQRYDYDSDSLPPAVEAPSTEN